ADYFLDPAFALRCATTPQANSYASDKCWKICRDGEVSHQWFREITRPEANFVREEQKDGRRYYICRLQRCMSRFSVKEILNDSNWSIKDGSCIRLEYEDDEYEAVTTPSWTAAAYNAWLAPREWCAKQLSVHTLHDWIVEELPLLSQEERMVNRLASWKINSS